MAWPATLPEEGERTESPSLTRLKRPIEGGSNQDAPDLIARNGIFRDLSRTNPLSSDVAGQFSQQFKIGNCAIFGNEYSETMFSLLARDEID